MLPCAPVLNFLWLELTSKCNLRCVHCYADSGPQRPLYDYMTADDWSDVLGQAAQLGCRSVQFIGGEPTLYPALGTLVEQARALDFLTVEVYTNGTRLTPKLKELFIRNKVALAFSVYATTAQAHDLVTKETGSFDLTISAINWALASGLSVRAAIIETDLNSEQSHSTSEMLARLGVKTIGVDRVRGVGRGGEERSPALQLTELCGNCSRGKLAVTATGDIFPCVFSRSWPVGHKRDGLRAAVEGLPLRSFCQELGATRDSRSAKELTHAGCTPDDLTCGPCLPEGPTCSPYLPCNPQCSPAEQPCQPDCQPLWPGQPPIGQAVAATQS